MKLISIQHIAVIILVMCLIPAHSQVNMQHNQSNNTFLNKMKPKVSVAISTSFNTFGYGYSAVGTSIMPKITLPVTDKFSLNAGIGYSSFLMSSDYQSPFSSSPNSYGHIFVSGDYLLNERITLRGTAYKTFSLGSRSSMLENSSPTYDFSSQGVIMDIEYKVTDNFRVNVGFEYRQQNYPMFNPGMHPTRPGMRSGSMFMEPSHIDGLSPF